MKPKFQIFLIALMALELLPIFALVRGLRPVGWFDAVIGIVLVSIVWTFTYLKWPKQ